MVCDIHVLPLLFEALNPNGDGDGCCGDTRIEEAGTHARSQAAQRSIGTEKQYVFVYPNCELCRAETSSYHTRDKIGRSSDIVIRTGIQYVFENDLETGWPTTPAHFHFRPSSFRLGTS